jgi:serine/threonine protein phosphatase 1
VTRLTYPKRLFRHAVGPQLDRVAPATRQGPWLAGIEQPCPESRRIYAIGDIHGCDLLLDRMIEAINRDAHGLAPRDALVVTLGDYVDRGPGSRAVIERLAHNPFSTDFIALKGNHEVLLERFLAEPETARYWRQLGGIETMRSYGVDVADVKRGNFYDAAAAALKQAMPLAHREFVASLKTSVTAGRYFLCHAGVRPGVPLDRQSQDDLLTIRETFLHSRADLGKVVVHGHTPVEDPELRPNRINVDTGAFVTGRLTCAVLEGERVRFLTVC